MLPRQVGVLINIVMASEEVLSFHHVVCGLQPTHPCNVELAALLRNSFCGYMDV